MKAAYIDTSLLIGIKFRGSSVGARRIAQKYRLFSSELLIAEIRAFLGREGLPEDVADREVEGIGWIIPDRSLADEIRVVARHGYLRGADVWHLACAFYLSPEPEELSFLTLDQRQREVAAKMGFLVPDLG